MKISRNLVNKLNLFFKLKRINKDIIVGRDIKITKKFRYKVKFKGNIIIGDNVYIDGYLKTEGRGKIQIGNNCSFRQNTFIGAVNSVKIGNNVFGAENIFIVDNNNHPISPKERYKMTMTPPGSVLWGWLGENVLNSPVEIEDNVWIGRYSMILKGVKIGKNSIIAAGSVVTKSVPQNSIVAGNPAKIVKTLINDLNK